MGQFWGDDDKPRALPGWVIALLFVVLIVIAVVATW